MSGDEYTVRVKIYTYGFMILIAAWIPVNFAATAPSYSNYARIVPIQQATLSSQITGKIQNIYVRNGDSFVAGKILVKFDCDVKEIELEQAIAKIKSNALALQTAKTLKETTSQNKAKISKANIQLQKTELERRHLEAQLKNCTIIAPFDGKVVEVTAYSHEDVSPGTPLLKIINDKDLEVELFIPSTWLQWLNIGASFTIQLDEIDQLVTAKVIKINPQVDTASQTIDVYGKLIDPSDNMLSGMSGVATFRGPE